jgi:hypothetical protein
MFGHTQMLFPLSNFVSHESECLPKTNCWEFKKCGRQVGGEKVKDLGVCPAAIERRIDGLHEGRFAGRCCWVVGGTFCGGTVQGSYAAKIGDCRKCEFFKLVAIEEGYNLKTVMQILQELKPQFAY